MRKSLSLVLLGLLVAAGYAAPCISAMATDQVGLTITPDQVTFTIAPDQVGLPRVGGTVRSTGELNDLMQRVIDREMAISYNQAIYLAELKRQACENMPVCEVDVLTPPRIEVIPARRLSKDILCNSLTCTAGFHETTTVSTTHSHEVGISAEVNASPFGMGVSFTTSYSYGFSTTNEESTTLSYEFHLEKGDFGYIAMASVQISAKLRIRGCICTLTGDHHTCMWGICPAHTTRPIDETGHHQAVVKEGDVPRSIVAFVYL